jgi:hypothetical protein
MIQRTDRFTPAQWQAASDYDVGYRDGQQDARDELSNVHWERVALLLVAAFCCGLFWSWVIP